MAVRIRMRRIGKNPIKKPHFRITVFDERTTRDGRFIEELGYYNPVSKASKVNKERYDYFIPAQNQLDHSACTGKILSSQHLKSFLGQLFLTK